MESSENSKDVGILAAIVPKFGPADQMAVARIARPSLQADDDVLVEVHASAVTPLDTYLRAGVKVGAYTPAPPYTPGFAMAGTLLSDVPGDAVLVEGRRVYGRAKSGANAEVAVCSATDVFPLPEGIPFPDAALICVPFETAYYSLFDLGGAQGGDTVLIHGAGGAVGRAAAQLAVMRGIHVIATCGERDVEIVRSFGVGDVVDYRSPNLADSVLARAGQSGINVVIDVAAKTNLPLDLEVAAPQGRVIIVGGTGPVEMDALPIISKGLTVAGVSLPSMSKRRIREIHATLYPLLERGLIKPHAATRFPLASIAEAHRAIEEGRGSGGVVIVRKV